MHPCRLIPLIALAASAQDPWAPVLEALRDQRAPGRYLVAGVGIDLGPEWILKDEVVSALQVSQLGQRVLKGAPGQQLQALLKGPGWALFAPDGRRLAEGPGTPDPARIREAMAKDGWTWLREDLKTHLARHPEDGQAWVELAMDLTRQAQQGWVPGTDTHLSMPPERRARFLGELEAAVAGLLKVPEGEQAWLQAPRQSVVFVTLFLGVSEFRMDPQVRQLVDRLAAPFAELASRDPENERIWNVFYSLHAPDETTTWREAGELMEQLGPVPGRPWPPLGTSFNLALRFGEDQEALAVAAKAWIEGNLTPELRRRLGRNHEREVLKAWGATGLGSLIALKRLDEAVQWIQWLRSLAGAQWPAVREKVLRDSEPVGGNREPFGDLTPAEATRLRDALAQPPLPDRPLPPFLPLRLASVGLPDSLAWGRLQADPLLDPWEPSELSWKPLSKAEAARFEGHQGWVLLRGEERLASGAGMPTAQQLNAALRQHDPPRLEVLDAYLKAHPGRLDARRERIAALTNRMPHPRLEGRLVEDLESLAGTFKAPPVSDASVWRPAAKRVCAQLRERLRCWPFHDQAWAAYGDWCALDPSAPRPGALLEGLEAWPRLRGILQPGPLPVAVSLAMARKLGTAGRWEELRGWGDALWRMGLQSWLRQGVGIPSVEKGTSSFDTNLLQVRQLLAWHGQALAMLGKTAEREARRQELESLRPGLGTALTTPPSE